MTRWFAWLRRSPSTLPPCTLTLVPANDVEPDADGYRSIGNDPYFLLQPAAGGFPVGLCEFSFEALPGTAPLQPLLFCDTGDGFNEAQSVRLAGGEAGVHRQLVTLPPGLVRLRFDPTALSGPLPLRHVRLLPRGPRPSRAEGEYARWVEQYDTLDAGDIRLIQRQVAQWRPAPRIAVQVDGSDMHGRTADSLRRQLLPPCPADADADATLHLGAGDVLAPHALYCLAAGLRAHPEAMVLTMDADRIDPATGERDDPRFRAAWSPDAVSEGDDPGPLLVRRGAASLAQLPASAFRHIPSVLVHRTNHPVPDVAEPTPPAATPLVSVIVPTRNHAALLRRALDGVLARTDYPAIEVIVMDNGSDDPAALACFAALSADPRVRVIASPGPFNYSQLNNDGVAAARGEVVVLLNNDIDVIGPGWLRELVRHVLQPGVGAVGCKLLYADGSVQHAGIVTGMTGLAGHVFRGMPGDTLGPHGILAQARTVAAVTGACLAMRRSVYQEVGGLDAAGLAVSYNDVDLCLRLREAGYRIVWTPDAVLHHLESATRGQDADPANAKRAQREHDVLLRRWGARLLQDPFWSVNLSVDDERGGLAWPPRRVEVWRGLD